MAASSAGLHEPEDRLSTETIDEHRAVVSIMEELEAVDWYHQRSDAARDPDLVAILIHNRDEEKEHAAMLLEWIRRHDPVVERQLRNHLFKAGAIVTPEQAAEARGLEGEGNGRPAASIGSLKEVSR